MARVLHEDGAVEILNGGKPVSLLIQDKDSPGNIPEKHTIFLFLFVGSTGVLLAMMEGGVIAAGAIVDNSVRAMAVAKLNDYLGSLHANYSCGRDW
jgi:hypothetical protein